MKISALDEYGLRCLLRLGRCHIGNSLTINEIAEMEGLSEANVRKLLMMLRQSGFVQSVRGRTGGYALASSPSEITVGQVMEALGGRMYDDEFCGKHSGDVRICVNSTGCSVKSLWGVLDGLVSGILHRIRLSDLLVTDGSLSMSLRQHVDETVEEVLGKRAGMFGLPVIRSG